jgi:hypothetical protein
MKTNTTTRGRSHRSSLSFVNQSQPVEPEPTAREAYLAAHPQARELQESAIAEFRAKFAKLLDGLKPLLWQFVAKAELTREIGIVLLELADSLPGKKLTRDFYEQMKSLFVDAQGMQITFEQLEWFMKIARSRPDAPIVDMRGALPCLQPLLLTAGDAEFQLVSDAPPKQRIPPPDEFVQITSFFEKADLVETWARFKGNEKYWADGHLRPEVRMILAEELKPKLAVIEELRREVGI